MALLREDWQSLAGTRATLRSYRWHNDLRHCVCPGKGRGAGECAGPARGIPGAIQTGTICLGYACANALSPGAWIDLHDRPHNGRPGRPRLPECDKQGQAGATLIGPAFGFTWVLRSCRCNAQNALVKRHLARPPAEHEECPPFPERFARAIRPYYYDNFAFAERDWLAKWPASKRTAIEVSIRDDPLLFGRVKLMVKRECGHALPTKARGIQMYRNLRTQALSGPWHTRFQKALCEACKTTKSGYELYPGIFVLATSGWNTARFDEWACDHAGHAWYFESDVSNFDSSVRACITHARADFAAIVDPTLAAEIRAHIRFRGKYFGDRKFDYGGVGTVKSGHNDTTWGNTLTTLVIAAEAMRRNGQTGSILAAGDDLLIAGNGPNPGAIAAYQRACGFEPKYSVWSHLADATFVSSCFLFDGRMWRFAPMVGRIIRRMWWTVSPPSQRLLPLRRAGDAAGVLTSHAGHPIYEALLRPWWVRGVEPTRVHHVGGLTAGGFDYTRALAAKYGTSPAQISAWAHAISEVATEIGVYELPNQHILDNDIADVSQRQPSLWGSRLE